MTAATVTAIVSSALGIVAQVAPGLLAAWTGAPSDEEAIEAARAMVAKLPVATTADDADLAARIAGGTRSGSEVGEEPGGW